MTSKPIVIEFLFDDPVIANEVLGQLDQRAADDDLASSDIVEVFDGRQFRARVTGSDGFGSKSLFDANPAAIGRRWLADSSLKEWFPLTAERLRELEGQAMPTERLARLRDKTTRGAGPMTEALVDELLAAHDRMLDGARSLAHLTGAGTVSFVDQCALAARFRASRSPSALTLGPIPETTMGNPGILAVSSRSVAEAPSPEPAPKPKFADQCALAARERASRILERLGRTSDPEAIDHPAHYGGAESVYEAIKVIEAWALDFCLGNAVKYLARAGKKPGEAEVKDLRKAVWYIQRRIEQLEKMK